MLYYLVRPVVNYLIGAYYRRVEVEGLEHIPADAAVVLAANHPTAFIEPCILACRQERTLWFLARGNLFKNALASWALDALHILPVFRIEDGGYGRLRDNFSTFAACHRALSRRRAVMILAEGRCIHERALRPLRKGTGRVALGALMADPTLPEVYVVPVGCNFTRPERMRSRVMIRCGPPLLASDYRVDYQTDEARTLRRFTADLRAALEPLVVRFPDQARAPAGEVRLAVARAALPADPPPGLALDTELAVAASVPEFDPAALELGSRLRQQGVTAAEVAGRGKDASPWWGLAAIAFLFPLWPLLGLAEWIARAKVNHIEFYSPVRFAALAIGLFVLVPLALVLLPWVGKIWLLATLVLLRPALGAIDELGSWYRGRRWRQLVAAERERMRGLFAGIREGTGF